mmetsp:Transcript_35622/g.96622  ORF Transcript_35622/g.96622 Transcript_35622/m.96622 type:complete len:256 (-) Transcript_35622:300-1067(-)
MHTLRGEPSAVPVLLALGLGDKVGAGIGVLGAREAVLCPAGGVGVEEWLALVGGARGVGQLLGRDIKVATARVDVAPAVLAPGVCIVPLTGGVAVIIPGAAVGAESRRVLVLSLLDGHGDRAGKVCKAQALAAAVPEALLALLCLASLGNLPADAAHLPGPGALVHLLAASLVQLVHASTRVLFCCPFVRFATRGVGVVDPAPLRAGIWQVRRRLGHRRQVARAAVHKTPRLLAPRGWVLALAVRVALGVPRLTA